jgi:hypothetical protein
LAAAVQREVSAQNRPNRDHIAEAIPATGTR